MNMYRRSSVEMPRACEATLPVSPAAPAGPPELALAALAEPALLAAPACFLLAGAGSLLPAPGRPPTTDPATPDPELAVSAPPEADPPPEPADGPPNSVEPRIAWLPCPGPP
jgi:hypothetical protein